MTNDDSIKGWSTYSLEEIEKFGDDGDFARQYLLTPTIFQLLGDVKGKKILDAGCGTGYLSRKLAKLGANVTGVEPAAQTFAYNLDREKRDQLEITYINEDLSKLTQFNETFDVVVSNMVLMDIPDYKTAVKNCVASLKRGGIFLFSVLHPCFEEGSSEWPKKNYVEVREYFKEDEVTQRFGTKTHRTLSSYLNLVIDAGCVITKIVEPTMEQKDVSATGEGDREVHVPSFIFIKSIKV